jgi:cold-inducible RNA-binding protein
VSIYVGNLAQTPTEDTLRRLFEQHGGVTRVNIITDHTSGESRGFAFIEMSQTSEAEKAIAGLNGYELDGNNIKVNVAKPRNESSSRF